ncbi:hypothetical protein WJX74_007231 [Apatococcus lobatus]|uniref:Uncharacterized protein n=1 Tax=Apatococcus lobatus TaxID=904363 RepID=A0AAW1S2I9_9CHLO
MPQEKRDQPEASESKDAPAQPPDAKKQIVEEEKSKMPKELVEQGRVAFFYRAKLNVQDEPDSLVDVQRFYMILSPTSREKAPHRLVVVGKKKMPSVQKRERFFGFCEAIGSSVDELTSKMGDASYDTATRGTRTNPSAIAAGQGVYSIVERGRQTHLVYTLETPEKPGKMQDVLDIPQEGSYTLSIRNPETPNVGNAGLENKPDFSPEKMKKFGGYRWASASDPSFLDVERCELLLIGASTDLKGELGEAGEHMHKLAEEDFQKYISEGHQHEDEAHLKKLQEEYRLEAGGLPVDGTVKEQAKKT